MSALDSAAAFMEGAERLDTLKSLVALRLANQMLEEALVVLEDLIDEDPDDEESIRQLVRCLEQTGRTDDLRRRLQSWVDEFKDKRHSSLGVELTYKLGCIVREEGDVAAAIELFESVNRQDSSNVGNLLALGDALSEMERWQETAKTLNTAVLYQEQMTEGDKLSLFKLLGRAREELGENDKASQMYRRALALAPSDENVKKRLERLREV